MLIWLFFFFFSSRRRHTRCREVSWARRCVQETGLQWLCNISRIYLVPNSPLHFFFSKYFRCNLARYYSHDCEHSHCFGFSRWIFYGSAESIDHRKRMLSMQIFLSVLHLLHGFFHLHIFALHHHHLISVSYTHLTLPTILLVQISVVAVSLKKKKNNKKIIIQ
eukprot:TRINITY_DN7215_c0_g1_i1.p1 TRINITY_DN7215_c0_g1~~TRINITY_DN7215_c0_g1_i1.p1  ORF type:complete len:164 (+),score=41.89 TRINITY_DN7215_c0_g1_i1:76-567(+)